MDKEFIEIPFDAIAPKRWECTIPEGFEAEIKDGKITVKEKESEDERIRKVIFELVEARPSKEFVGDISKDDCLAYLEKQKEPHYSPLCNTIKDKIREYIANHFIADRVVKTDMKSIVKAMEEGVRLGKEEQKPAECSEEEIINWLKENFYVSSFDNTKIITKFSSMDDLIKSVRKRFKSLHPQPKQEWSEEDKMHLNNAILAAEKEWGVESCTAKFLKSFRPQSKQEKMNKYV